MRCSYFKRNKNEALICYKQASEGENKDASYKIAELLIDEDNKNDIGVIKRYLNLAHEQGHPTANQKLTEWENPPASLNIDGILNFFRGATVPSGLNGDDVEDDRL